MADSNIGGASLTPAELREEFDRFRDEMHRELRQYATKADVAHLKTLVGRNFAGRRAQCGWNGRGYRCCCSDSVGLGAGRRTASSRATALLRAARESPDLETHFPVERDYQAIKALVSYWVCDRFGALHLRGSRRRFECSLSDYVVMTMPNCADFMSWYRPSGKRRLLRVILDITYLLRLCNGFSRDGSIDDSTAFDAHRIRSHAQTDRSGTGHALGVNYAVIAQSLRISPCVIQLHVGYSLRSF